MRRVYFFMMAILVITGCGSAFGNKRVADFDVISQIKIGKTTKDDVRGLLGDPNNVILLDEQNESWYYHYSRADVRPATFVPIVGLFAGGFDTKVNTLSVLFDSDGVVKKLATAGTSGGGGGLQDLDK